MISFLKFGRGDPVIWLCVVCVVCVWYGGVWAVSAVSGLWRTVPGVAARVVCLAGSRARGVEMCVCVPVCGVPWCLFGRCEG